MAYTCSFSYVDDLNNNNLFRNKNCFMKLLQLPLKNEKIVIIEKEKQIPSTEKTIEYLNDLISMGFIFTHKIVNNDIHVNVTNISRSMLLPLLQAIRYLWEGRFDSEQLTPKSDEFYKIIEFYFELKKLNNKKHLENLCLAINKYIEIPNKFTNHNHLWCNNSGCKILDKLEFEKITSTNFYFSKII